MDRAFTDADAASMAKQDPQQFLQRLGMQIRLARVERGLSQERLALEAGMQRAALSRLERGMIDPKATTLHKLAFALDADAGEWFRARP
jgi:transcriptional regulator with XRE-family HTH domain